MCVYHNQIEMFDHLMEHCGATDNVRNIEGFTPLVLAASLGFTDMFQHILCKRRKVGWSYGPVSRALPVVLIALGHKLILLRA